MHITSLFDNNRPVFSFEFFPPKTEGGVEKLFRTIADLRELNASFVSVTYGALGNTRDLTIDLVRRIRRELDIEPMAHLTCVGASQSELRHVLEELRQSEIDNVLALRGDPPKGETAFIPPPDGLSHASELAELISQNYGFCIGGACYPEGHPESVSLSDDVRFARLKVDKGAQFLITQLFFDNNVYFDFVRKARIAGITVPIVPGIMPITDVAQIARMTGPLGASMPPDLLAALYRRNDDPEAVIQLGVAYATMQCAELLAAGAPGIHFYTMNRSPATRAILSALQSARPWEREPVLPGFAETYAGTGASAATPLDR